MTFLVGSAMEEKPYERLQKLRKAKNIGSAKEAAARFGWPKDTYIAHESGSRGIRPAVAAKYAKAYGGSPEYLLFGSGDIPKVPPAPQVPSSDRFSAEIPLCGAVAGSEERIAINYGDQIETVARHPKQVGIDGAFAAYVIGESMVPMYKPGQVVYLHPNRPAVRGEGCVIEMKNGEGYLKEYDGSDESNFYAHQYNPKKRRSFKREDVFRVLLVVGTGIR